jgi:hypothetical protein
VRSAIASGVLRFSQVLWAVGLLVIGFSLPSLFADS